MPEAWWTKYSLDVLEDLVRLITQPMRGLTPAERSALMLSSINAATRNLKRQRRAHLLEVKT